ncbi:hypothetical protein F4820DRAFT_128205 [Hypoxylon rubiginosum]|uniref:Uncharacterized protein n=1 Tax=Hypoxylon rubiginosum TaxID=110542 RepID=A0ACB9YLI0_9PEZI|nr:hypothetical protein F4820DRAFT_128205 [Hypoxylon rubiginosum]
MQALTTAFTAPSWCLDRFVVYIDNNRYHSSTLSPSRGWVDPSFTKCVPSQYTTSLQVFSPGVCPDYMTFARTTSHVHGDKTTWTGGCCQSGFSDMNGYFCTSTVTTPMAFLLEANVSTTDIYTTLSDLWIEHDQMTVAWQETDMEVLPKKVSLQYGSIMGPPVTTTTAESSTATHSTQVATVKTTSTIATATSATNSPSVAISSAGWTSKPISNTETETNEVDITITSTKHITATGNIASSPTPTSSSPTTFSSGSWLLWRAVITLIAGRVLLRGLY